MQAVSYTTGVPAMVGAMMFLTGKWNLKGVRNVEEFDPDPFPRRQQLSWHGLQQRPRSPVGSRYIEMD